MSDNSLRACLHLRPPSPLGVRVRPTCDHARLTQIHLWPNQTQLGPSSRQLAFLLYLTLFRFILFYFILFYYIAKLISGLRRGRRQWRARSLVTIPMASSRSLRRPPSASLARFIKTPRAALEATVNHLCAGHQQALLLPTNAN